MKSTIRKPTPGRLAAPCPPRAITPRLEWSTERSTCLAGGSAPCFVNASPTDVVEEYDPATDSWGVAKARMPNPRSGTAYGSYGGKIYVAGGEYLDNQIVGVYRELQAYDPAKDEWTHASSHGHAADMAWSAEFPGTVSMSSAATCSREIFMAIRWIPMKRTRFRN